MPCSSLWKRNRECNDFCVVHLFNSNSRRHSNDSLIASPRRHIDIHRKWEHEIMVVLGNIESMETRRYNCSKQYAVSYKPVGIIEFVLLLGWQGTSRCSWACWFTTKLLLLSSCVIRSHWKNINTPLQTPLPSSAHMAGALLWTPHKPSNAASSVCKHLAASKKIYLCFLSIVPYCFAPFGHLRQPPRFIYCHLF